MLSNEPPDAGCGAAMGCCCGAVTTGLTGAAGWEKTNKNDTLHICLWAFNLKLTAMKDGGCKAFEIHIVWLFRLLCGLSDKICSDDI